MLHNLFVICLAMILIGGIGTIAWMCNFTGAWYVILVLACLLNPLTMKSKKEAKL